MAVGRYWRAVLVGYWTTGAWTGEMATTGISGVASDQDLDIDDGIALPLPSFTANATGEFSSQTAYDVYYGSEGPAAWRTAVQDEIADAFVTFAGAIKVAQASSFQWEEIRISAYDNNKDVINGASVYYLKVPVVGAGNASYTSPSVSLAASLRSGGRGPANRGRMFIPTPGFTATNTGTVSTANRNVIGNAVKGLVTTLTAIPNIQPCVVSTTRSWYSSISRIDVGDEWDDVSRRRRRRQETYTSY